ACHRLAAVRGFRFRLGGYGCHRCSPWVLGSSPVAFPLESSAAIRRAALLRPAAGLGRRSAGPPLGRLLHWVSFPPVLAIWADCPPCLFTGSSISGAAPSFFEQSEGIPVRFPDGDLLVRLDAGSAGDDDPALDGRDGLIERLQGRVELGEGAFLARRQAVG